MTSRNSEKFALGDLSPIPISSHSTVILVEPKDPRNIGAVARAMSNLGFSRLRLVAPQDFDRDLARAVSCWGSDILDRAEIFSDLRQAVADTHEVVGFASDSSEHRVAQVLLDDWVSGLPVIPDLSVGLVFGSEENGLRREHFPFCQHLVRIPSSHTNRSFNLAQAVLLVLYTLTKQLKNGENGENFEYVTSSQLELFTNMVLHVAEQSKFLNENSPQHMRDLLVNMTRRGRLTARELKILTGLFGHIKKALQRE